MKKPLILTAVVAVLMVAGLACSLSSLTTRKPQSLLPPSGLTSDPDALVLGQGLDSLQSYRAHLLVRFNGTDEKGQPGDAMNETLVEANRARQAYHRYNLVQTLSYKTGGPQDYY